MSSFAVFTNYGEISIDYAILQKTKKVRMKDRISFKELNVSSCKEYIKIVLLGTFMLMSNNKFFLTSYGNTSIIP